MLGGRREELDALGLSRLHIELPGEESPMAPLEGALRVRADGGRFVLETVDYGQSFRLLSAETESEITRAVIAYVSRPLPPVRAVSQRDVITIGERLAGHYVALREDAGKAGPQGIVIRFTLQQPETGLRDLVVSGRLQRIQIQV